ncbi:5-formyltetrahydrofolate cyclo-ligase [Abyssisolibacter fermentans]|uniref:5-formyltetrahydrofolate cyclo-ligase n=1 Tax=Abyssisolibacter fermentans TaxID=1766203 RepID=UPI00082A7323|nr:5-formyltetrahydrofolate cyclo-ligase [Abyssisolibacter fermentans]
MDEKAIIRIDMLKKRRNMTKEEVAFNSDRIKTMLTEMNIIKKSKTIMLYLSFGNEVNTFSLLEWCIKNNKKVVVPYCIEKEKKIIPSEIRNVDEDLTKSPLGFLQPKLDKLKEVPVLDIDLVIVPGVVFDIKGNRIGFGGGYYDRFLNRALNATSIAVCHDYQLLGEVPKDKYDVPMNQIVTEKKKVTIY